MNVLNRIKPLEALPTAIPSAAYLHIPFCRRRCYYCDFPVSVIGGARGQTSGTIEQYIDILCQEIKTVTTDTLPLKTIFFGGGTPSLLSVSQLERILATLQAQIGIAEGCEISMEIDPGTFDLQQLQGYQHLGVNRVSLGVQAFQEELLQRCGRSHSVSDVYKAVDLISQSGIDNFSLDLISGLPNQTLNHWQDSLESAVKLAPKHISCYDLVVEPVTAFGKQYQPGEKPLPTDENTAQMYRLAQQILTASGYEHYEISNYAQPGYQCRHNRVYWENHSYYGFGMGAASYVGGDRFTRPRTRREYYAWVEARLNNQDNPVNILTQSDILLETLMLGLRLKEGLDLSRLSKQFGKEITEQILQCVKPYLKSGWVEVTEKNSLSYLRLTDPEGFLFSNTILSTLFSEFE